MKVFDNSSYFQRVPLNDDIWNAPWEKVDIDYQRV